MAKFADYFTICGLDYNSGLEPDKYSEDNLHVSPLERCYKSQVLAHYPENSKTNPFDASAVCMLALPNGLKFRTQKHSVTQAPNFHSFIITREDGKRCYGFSLIFYEEVRNRDICTAMQTLQAMYVQELSSGLKTKPVQPIVLSQGPRSLPRHFKLSTPNPNGASLTYYDITKDKLFVSKSIGIICQAAYIHAAKIFLENLYRCVPRKPSSLTGLSLESYVFNLLYEIELPPLGKSILIHLPPSDPNLPLTTAVLQNPAPPLELPHLDYPLRLLFTWLGVDMVVQLFTCLLLENQVLIRSTDCQKLMVVAEGLMALMFPFQWPHVYVPILPAALHHFLDAPVPFLMGLNAASENIKVASEASLCYIDIDKCKIQLPEEMVFFPHMEGFTAEIHSILDKYRVHVPKSESNRSLQDLQLSRSCTLPGKPQNRRTLSIHDTLDNERPTSPPGSARSEALQRIADIVRRTGVVLDKNDSYQPGDSYLEEMTFNNAMRETFLNRFVHVFWAYENFVIFPSNHNKEDWFNNRDSMQNFDKASFLSDQPEQDRLFLLRFLESQMFATLIDSKILSQWGEQDNNLLIFDNRIKLLKQRYAGENLMRGVNYEPCTTAHDTQKLIDRRMQFPDFESPVPREVGSAKTVVSRQFPILDKGILNKTPVVNKGSIPRARDLKRGSLFGKPPTGLSNDKGSKSGHQTNHSTQDMSPALIAQANWTFVEKLLKAIKAIGVSVYACPRILLHTTVAGDGLSQGSSIIAEQAHTPIAIIIRPTRCNVVLTKLETDIILDCKTKTKRMLLAKLGAEGVTLSSNNTSDSFGAVEESTLVASLCDFLERVWSHGLQKKRGKSALWSHLLAYQEKYQQLNKRQNNYLSKDDVSQLTTSLENWPTQTDRNIKSDLPDLPNDILFDISNVQAMHDVKTGIGFARAWVRLALEKKQLSKHFRTLLSDQVLLRNLYKRNAFLRSEEEKDQFLYHLLSLNAVDYFCFTSTYPMTVIPYRIVIIPNKKGAYTSANIWLVLSGTLSETQRVMVPKNSFTFEHKQRNLGVLTTLRIGHDNSGLYAKLMLDSVLVRNEITGHIYRFSCGRWLGRGVDDGSTERLLVGTLISKKEEEEEVRSTGSLGRSTPRTRSPIPLPKTEMKPSQIQHMLGDCVNNIVKWHYRRNSERHTTLTALLCGENGLVYCLENVFLLGFKSARMFMGKHYLWDYFVRVKEQFETELIDEVSGTKSNRTGSLERNHQQTVAVWRCYCHLIEEMMHSGKSLGKDGKFQLFICLSVREHLLHRMLVPMAACRVTQEMYEENSFLRNRGLLTFLRQILLPLDELEVVLENSVTYGITSPSQV